MKRNLYIISFNKVGWDEYDSFLVSAKDKEKCEMIVRKEFSSGANWSEGFEIEKVGETNKPKGIIMESFNAG